MIRGRLDLGMLFLFIGPIVCLGDKYIFQERADGP